MRAMIGTLAFCVGACAVLSPLPTSAQEPTQASPGAESKPAGEAAPPSYSEHVLPVFRKYCLGCHDAENAEGGLVMEPFEKLLAGGENGAALAPGSAERSRLFRLVTGKSEPKMPPEDSAAPTPDEIALLGRWIDAGAKGPTGAEPAPSLIAPKIKPKVATKPAIHSLAIAPDGKLIALGGFQTVRIVDRATSVIVKTFTGHAGSVNNAAFTRDSQRLLAAGGEPGLFGEVKLWNLADGKLLQTYTGHTDSLYTAELSPDEKTLATGSYDKLAILWDVATAKPKQTLKGHNGAVYSLAFSPDGSKLVTASADATAKLWNVADGSRLETFPQSLKGLYAALYTPDGKRVVAAGSDNRIRIWEISPTAAEGTNKLLFSRFAHQAPIVEMALTKSGDLLASAAEDRTVKIWDGATFIEKLAIESQPDWPSALAFAPDGKSLLVGRIDGSLAFYDPATGAKQADVNPMPPKPELSGVSIRGLQRGQTTTLKLTGKHLSDVSEA
ncbi:MAG TPA: c-type cytochrome domain-containing protein, partial [Pirellulales bacterium]